MKKTLLGFMGVLLLMSLIGAGCQESEKEPVLGESCGTVTPGYNDECCERQNKDTIHIQCVGAWKYNFERDECEFICGGGQNG